MAGSFASACKAIGIGRDRGNQLLRDPLNNAYLAFLQEKLVDVTLIDRQWVQLQYLKLYEQAIGEEEIPFVDREGTQMLVKKWDGNTARGLLESMGRMTNLDKAVGKDGHGVTINLDLGNFTGRVQGGDEGEGGTVIDITPEPVS